MEAQIQSSIAEKDVMLQVLYNMSLKENERFPELFNRIIAAEKLIVERQLNAKQGGLDMKNLAKRIAKFKKSVPKSIKAVTPNETTSDLFLIEQFDALIEKLEKNKSSRSSDTTPHELEKCRKKKSSLVAAIADSEKRTVHFEEQLIKKQSRHEERMETSEEMLAAKQEELQLLKTQLSSKDLKIKMMRSRHYQLYLFIKAKLSPAVREPSEEGRVQEPNQNLKLPEKENNKENTGPDNSNTQ